MHSRVFTPKDCVYRLRVRPALCLWSCWESLQRSPDPLVCGKRLAGPSPKPTRLSAQTLFLPTPMVVYFVLNLAQHSYDRTVVLYRLPLLKSQGKTEPPGHNQLDQRGKWGCPTGYTPRPTRPGHSSAGRLSMQNLLLLGGICPLGYVRTPCISAPPAPLRARLLTVGNFMDTNVVRIRYKRINVYTTVKHVIYKRLNQT